MLFFVLKNSLAHMKGFLRCAIHILWKIFDKISSSLCFVQLRIHNLKIRPRRSEIRTNGVGGKKFGLCTLAKGGSGNSPLGFSERNSFCLTKNSEFEMSLILEIPVVDMNWNKRKTKIITLLMEKKKMVIQSFIFEAGLF